MKLGQHFHSLSVGTAAYAHRDDEVIETHDGRDSPWPGREQNVRVWVALATGYLVAFVAPARYYVIRDSRPS